MTAQTSILVRAAHARDFEEIARLQRERRPALPELELQRFDARRARFPEGQLVAESGGRVLGFAATLIVQWDDYGPDVTWRHITGDGTFSTHDETGRTLFVADVVAAKGWREAAVARALHRELRQLCRRAGLRRIIAACALPGYRKVRNVMQPEIYAMRVAWCDNVDAELSPQLSRGYRYCGVIHNFRPEDVDSCGHGALLAWPNPAYRLRPASFRRPVPRLAPLVPSPPALAT